MLLNGIYCRGLNGVCFYYLYGVFFGRLSVCVHVEISTWQYKACIPCNTETDPVN